MDSLAPIKRVLIANRGEVALRILRACHQLGIETVAIYSTVDKNLPHVALATYSVCIGNGPSQQSYLNSQAILAAADLHQVDAIHPGYGFLSENAEFAEQVEQCGYRFIGPSSDVIRTMGDKVSAIATMQAHGVPTTPGSDGLLGNDLTSNKQLATDIGYPVIIKATAGGGGKGMRIVNHSDELGAAIELTRAEADAAFGNKGIYLEKYLTQPRHIELQLLADKHGNVLCLGERDCSMQRQQQKVIEEAPAINFSETLRQQISELAIKACQAIGYCGAGTIEFLYQDGQCFFMEMNTRLQVEHPVTELVSHIDIVAEQLNIASGKPLALSQQQVRLQGHAIECRINAEHPQSFLPSSGKVTHLVIPGGIGVRWDSHLYTGYVVPHHYDAMVAKLITYGDSRQQAIERMQQALSELHIAGIDTNIALLRNLLTDPGFIEGGQAIHYLEHWLANVTHA
ncbi:acetyl-CoA carboxylase biotin carboxylase subunit [Shewanella sp. Scap07]|uniref:acetyl-CoA carboxylase biotin carboxylase subunit n=1 Tax=Shewanella sp. Scap07 TaxID=2589987 RepID=UPI0015BD98E3|nr:acetyl-CoA carboxylase biotin carboxylase subunit [Shewanella sp. Scap07]QLE84082.1 acetyl-CoA carboxylase biotin carboxylase subunit [Shewanella sp. Scap07]